MKGLMSSSTELIYTIGAQLPWDVRHLFETPQGFMPIVSIISGSPMEQDRWVRRCVWKLAACSC